MGAAPTYQRHPLHPGASGHSCHAPPSPTGSLHSRRSSEGSSTRMEHGDLSRHGSSVEMTAWVNGSPLSKALTIVLRSSVLRTRRPRSSRAARVIMGHALRRRWGVCAEHPACEPQPTQPRPRGQSGYQDVRAACNGGSSQNGTATASRKRGSPSAAAFRA